jgi:hypothetical protein
VVLSPEGFFMCESGKVLKVRRYLQKPGECSIAAAASVANFYDSRIDYAMASRLAANDGDGMYTPDIGRLLNRLGFTEVTIVSADLKQIDFKWKNFNKARLIEQFKLEKKCGKDIGVKELAGAYAKFLSDRDNENNLLIDFRFGDYIRESIRHGAPVLASYNWNMYFELPKWNIYGEVDPIRGDFEEHQVAIYGCDSKGVNVVDSHYEMYRGRLNKYRTGRYKMSWEQLMTVMGYGDLIIPSGFSSERVDELVQAE